MSDLQAAVERIANSDASGIDHSEIYGHSIERDLAVLGRAYLAFTDPTPIDRAYFLCGNEHEAKEQVIVARNLLLAEALKEAHRA